MKKNFYFIILFYFYFLFNNFPINAFNYLKIKPAEKEIITNANKEIETEFTIYTESPNKDFGRISIEEINYEGNKTYSKENNPEIIIISPKDNNFILNEKEEIKVIIKIKIPEKTEKKEYLYNLVFNKKNGKINKGEIQFAIEPEIKALINLKITKDLSNEEKINNIKLEPQCEIKINFFNNKIYICNNNNRKIPLELTVYSESEYSSLFNLNLSFKNINNYYEKYDFYNFKIYPNNKKIINLNYSNDKNENKQIKNYFDNGDKHINEIFDHIQASIEIETENNNKKYIKTSFFIISFFNLIFTFTIISIIILIFILLKIKNKK